MRDLVAVLVAGAAVFAVGGGCGSAPSRYDEVGRWQCFEDAAECECFGTPETTNIVDPRKPVVSCRPALDCCFVSERADATFECRCLVAPPREGGAGGEAGGEATANLDCHAAALDAGSTEVVPRCPPVTLDDPAVCALAFEGCDPEYLETNGLIACCAGTVCRTNQHGVEVCQPD